MPIIVDLAAEPGSSLDLCAIWFNLAANPADLCAFRYVGDGPTLTTDPRAEIRQLAGRRRLIRRGTAAYDSHALTLTGCRPDQVAWLRDHVAQLMCIRDHVGTKFYGTYLSLPREFATWTRKRADVKLVFDQVTYSEAIPG